MFPKTYPLGVSPMQREGSLSNARIHFQFCSASRVLKNRGRSGNEIGKESEKSKMSKEELRKRIRGKRKVKKKKKNTPNKHTNSPLAKGLPLRFKSLLLVHRIELNRFLLANAWAKIGFLGEIKKLSGRFFQIKKGQNDKRFKEK